MKVTLLKPEEAKELFEDWGTFAKVCYDFKGSSTTIGKHCLASGHFSGSRTNYIKFLIEDCPRFLIDQLIRKEVGTCKNVQSFRYVNKETFAYEIPRDITDNPKLVAKYTRHMNDACELYGEIQHYVQLKSGSKERANEQARYVLPMSTHGAVAIGFTIESLIEYCHKRLCVRTEDVHHELAKMLRKEAVEILPELEEYLVAQCEYLTWCPEGKGCGRYPKRGEKK